MVNVAWFYTNKVNMMTPSRDFDYYDYDLFLNFASQAELEGDYCVSETFTKIEEYKIQSLTPRVDFIENEETKELEEVIKYVVETKKKETLKNDSSL